MDIDVHPTLVAAIAARGILVLAIPAQAHPVLQVAVTHHSALKHTVMVTHQMCMYQVTSAQDIHCQEVSGLVIHQNVMVQSQHMQ